MNCPYGCGGEMKSPQPSSRPYGVCKKCKRKSRASVAHIGGVDCVTKYTATSLPREDRSMVKSKTLQIRVLEEDLKKLESGEYVIRMVKGKFMVTTVLQPLYKT